MRIDIDGPWLLDMLKKMFSHVAAEEVMYVNTVTMVIL